MPHDNWKARFTAPRPGLPDWALDAPHRSLYTCNTSGAVEIHAWDRRSGRHHQVTSRPSGTSLAALTPDGEWIWWFNDGGGDEFGQWMAQPFGAAVDGSAPAVAAPDGSALVPAAPDVPPGYPAGLALGRLVTLIACATDDGTDVWSVAPGGSARVIRRYEDDVELLALSADEDIAIVARPRPDHPSAVCLEVVDTATGAATSTITGPHHVSLDAFSFSPVGGDRRLVVRHEADGGRWLSVLDVETGAHRRIDVPDVDVDTQWYPDGSALLLTFHRHARSTLHRCDLTTGTLTQLPTPPGTIEAAAVRPDGRVEYQWSSSTHPPVIRTLDGSGDRVLFRPPGAVPPPGPELTDAWVETAAGRLHLLVARATAGPAKATVFLLHGGPHSADTDRYSAYRSAWTDAGFTVIHVNYRGSTGYGSGWRAAGGSRPGFPELEDLAASCDWAIEQGLAHPERCVVVGSSWGGFLALLALGRQPGRWAAGIGESPIADHAAAYADRPDFLQSFDRELFGGSPEQLPEAYRACSPLTYVSDVKAPVLLLVAENDARCPVRQIELYLSRLADEGKAHEVYRFDAGHLTMVAAELVRQTERQIAFVSRVLDGQ